MEKQREAIIRVLHQLRSEGQAASIAKVKRRLQSPVPMPLLLETIGLYKDAELPEIEPDQHTGEPERSSLSNEERISQLETEVQNLKLAMEKLSSALGKQL